MKEIILFINLFLLSIIYAEKETTLYEYYTSDGIKSGLSADNSHFTLNGKNITIISGSLHYFRVPHQYWRDRLQKFKAAGLNAVQFYSPWNLHEEIPGHFDFETGMLNLTDFLTAIKENDMFAVYRPGPYICSEWDMGGLPSWLLRDPNMKLRSNYAPYLKAAEKYFEKVLNIAKQFQFTTNGGPIIAMQIENEFASYGNTKTNPGDLEYLTLLEDTVRKNGYKGLVFTSDPGNSAVTNPIYKLKDVLETMNMNDDVLKVLTEMRKITPNRALYVSEYWSAKGWGDQWGAKQQKNSVTHFGQQYEDILFKANASLNVYMFIGGTNFGFMNGANGGKSASHSASTITSYDYDGPLSESGNYTQKYWKIKELNEKFVKERNLPKIKTPLPPKEILAVSYGHINVSDYIPLNQVLKNRMEPIISEKPVFMELLNIGPNYGQNFGFILYRTLIQKAKQIKLSKGVNDRTIVLIDSKEIAILESSDKEIIVNISEESFTKNSQNIHSVDLLVENTGRYNFGHEMQILKGINGSVYIDDSLEKNWYIFPLEFKQKFVEELNNEKWIKFNNTKSPAVFKAELDIKGKPNDTFMKLENWVKGIVFVNGFNIGRYWNIGPQKTLYIPAPLLKSGKNDIFIFELHSASNSISFVDKAILL